MKIRLDTYLAQNNLTQSREKAQAIIMAGSVLVDGIIATKSGLQVSNENKIEIKEKSLKYVSRGGLKLEKAIELFDINLEKKDCLDIGASTGGFTDCMLQNGANTVACVDVGYGQLAWSLRTNPYVTNFERTNIRYFDTEKTFDFISCDVAFISLKLVFPKIYSLMREGGESVCLIKPQFEAGKDKVGKKGVVRDKNTHVEVITNVIEFAKNNNLYPVGLTFSPIRGPEGNIEYLIHLKKEETDYKSDTQKIVEEAHVETSCHKQ